MEAQKSVKGGKLESRQRSANTPLTDILIINHWIINGPFSSVRALVEVLLVVFLESGFSVEKQIMSGVTFQPPLFGSSTRTWKAKVWLLVLFPSIGATWAQTRMLPHRFYDGGKKDLIMKQPV